MLELNNKNYENIITPYTIKNSLMAVKLELLFFTDIRNINKTANQFVDIVKELLDPINEAAKNFNFDDEVKGKKIKFFDEETISNNLRTLGIVSEEKSSKAKTDEH